MLHSYQMLATRLMEEIQSGQRAVGEKLPSVRAGAALYGVSTSTMVRCYRTLETQGWTLARPRSGMVVADWKIPTAMPLLPPSPPHVPSLEWEQFVPLQQRISQLYALTDQPLRVAMHLATAEPQWYPLEALSRIGQRVFRTHPQMLGVYPTGTGLPEFKTELSHWLHGCGLDINPDALLVTHGSTEALSISLRAVTQPGDAVVVESPVYFGLLQILESLGLKALEVPCIPTQGMSLEALEFALDNHSGIRAVVAMPRFQNPLGCAMSDSHKRRLLKLAERADVVVIEDDTFGDLSPATLHAERPQPLKAWDKTGRVIYCGSFSKSLAPAFRVGWVAGGRYHARIAALKLSHSLVCPVLEQAVLAQFLRSGGMAPHLRKLRERLASNVPLVVEAVRQHFPVDCRIHSEGGWWLWVICPAGTDTLAVLRQCVPLGVSFTPGVLFGSGRKTSHCLRMTIAQPWSEAMEYAIQTIGAVLRGKLISSDKSSPFAGVC